MKNQYTQTYNPDNVPTEIRQKYLTNLKYLKHYLTYCLAQIWHPVNMHFLNTWHGKKQDFHSQHKA